MKSQTQTAKLGEISYRSQIVKQHLGQKLIFKNEANRTEFLAILKKRVKVWNNDFNYLKKENLLKSPFLEVGAEYALASTILVNKFKLDGFALDISPASLSHAKDFAKQIKFAKTANLICADIETIPFAKNSFSFVFVYESLHHFTNPHGPIKEMYRVLSPGGTLLIGSEPIKAGFNLNIWKRPNVLRPWEKMLKAILILPFISKIGKTEIEHGIIETSFPSETWLNALSTIDKTQITISTYPFGQIQKLSSGKTKLNLKTRVLLFFLGGSINAICFKKGHTNSNKSTFFICPNCLDKKEREFKLEFKNDKYICTSCNTSFTKVTKIFNFLPKQLLEKTE